MQMAVNLLSNAVKFTPQSGAIALSAEVRADGGVSIEVRDTGIGIARDDIPKALADYRSGSTAKCANTRAPVWACRSSRR